MGQESNNFKKPMSEAMIFRNMMVATFAVAGIFFLKNLITQSWQGAIAIGICLVVFSIAVVAMRKLALDQERQQLIICVSIVLLVFCISLNSGSYYSDDFPLYLAVIGISGLYLVPKYTLIQTVLIDILLIAAYFIHPEKADPLSQYLMCVAIFTVGAYTFYMVIKRGRAYIEIGLSRTAEAEQLLSELKNAGEELQHSCDTSGSRIANLEEANERLKFTAAELRSGSEEITQGTVEVAETFQEVQERMQTTEAHISALNVEVKNVEDALADNKRNMQSMTAEMESLRNTVSSTDEVFTVLQSQMNEISAVTEQLTKIASSTTMLALNASIEAARAGQMGAGFAVVASKVQDLAEDSNACSAQVVSVVNNMQARIEQTTQQLSDSTSAINHSIDALQGFQDNFDHLTSQFNSLYQNIEEQNENVHQMDDIIANLRGKITEMTESSATNQVSVSAIADALSIYKDNIDLVVNDNKLINELSISMLELSQNGFDSK